MKNAQFNHQPFHYCSSCNKHNTPLKHQNQELLQNCLPCRLYNYLKGERKITTVNNINSPTKNDEIVNKLLQHSVLKSIKTKPNQRLQELKSKFKHAATEFGRISTKSNRVIPKEQQVSIDLGNKMIFNHFSHQLLQLPLTSKSASYIYEIGTKERIFGIDTTVKYFTPQEQNDHTRTPRMDEFGEWRLQNKDGSVYDTTQVFKTGGRIMYAVSLDCKLITALEILADDGIEYCCWHSSLLAAGPGLCFGSLVVDDGKIAYISNHSGHYNPAAENLYVVIKKLSGLFTPDAAVGVYYKSYDKFGDFRTNFGQTKVLSEKYYCTVQEFVERVEKGLPIVPGSDKIVFPDEYFIRIRRFNENYKLFVYKPVPVFNGNFVISVEHSLRKLIGVSYGRKPNLGVDDVSRRVIVCFRVDEDAQIFESILRERFGSLDFGSHGTVVFISRRCIFEFIVNVLKINLLIYL